MSDTEHGFQAPGPDPSGSREATTVGPTSWGAPPPVSPHLPPRDAFRPGVVPLRPLALGDLYGGVIGTIRGNVQATIGAGVLVSVAVLAVLTPLALLLANQQIDTRTSDPALDPYAAELSTTVGEQIPGLASLITPVVLAAFLAFVVGQAVLGRKVGLPETWRGTRRHLLRVLASMVLAFLGYVVVGAVVVLVPLLLVIATIDSGGAGAAATVILAFVATGLAVVAVEAFLWTRWAFVTPVIVMERAGVIAAFRRSWRLTAGRPFWRVFGLRLLTTLLVGIAGYILTLPLALAGAGTILASGADASASPVVGVVLNSLSVLIAGALTTPFTAGFDALLYVDQRIRREALDVTLIQAVSAGHGAAPGGPR